MSDELEDHLIDLFLPETAQKRKIAALAERAQTDSIRDRKLAERVDQLRRDVGFLILIQALNLKTLMDKGLLPREELHARLMEIDKLDGVGDGQVSPEALRALLTSWISGGEGGQPPGR